MNRKNTTLEPSPMFQLRPIVLSLTILVILPIAWGESALAQQKPQDRGRVEVSPEAERIHSASYVWDGHNDLPWAIRQSANSSFAIKDIAESQPDLMTDIPRLRIGNVGAQFWSVFVPSSTGRAGTALQTTIEQIELVRTMCEKYPDVFAFCTTVEDVDAARQAGKIASLIGVEGGHSIENSIANLRRLHALGAAYMTLTHSSTLDWADSATDEAKSDGLSKFGEEVVREMNRLGMLVDLSHVSTATMLDAIRISTAPIIYSHSSASGIASHPRNVEDVVLPSIRDNGGVIMVNFYNGYVVPADIERSRARTEFQRKLEDDNLSDEEAKAKLSRWLLENPPVQGTVHDLVDHIDYLVQNCGIDHVGIGSDYDGVSLLPKQIEDVSTYPVITQVMLDRGYSEQQIHQIMSGNIYRVFKQAKQLAD